MLSPMRVKGVLVSVSIMAVSRSASHFVVFVQVSSHLAFCLLF
jgi:hypothetical protein